MIAQDRVRSVWPLLTSQRPSFLGFDNRRSTHMAGGDNPPIRSDARIGGLDEPVIREMDRVSLRAAIALDQGCLNIDDRGTVVHRYRDGNAFEVEFITPIAVVVTLRKGEIERTDG